MKIHEKARQPKLFASPIVDGSLSKNVAVDWLFCVCVPADTKTN